MNGRAGGNEYARQAAQARGLLVTLRIHFEAAVGKLALKCSKAGRLSPAHLDQNQVASYEVALAGADLIAADTVLAALDWQSSDLDTQLGLVYVGDAILAVLARLQTLSLELELDRAALHALAADSDLSALLVARCSSVALASTGALLESFSGDFGRVNLDDEHVMVQDAFRRFATEMVAPRAEDIHRHDLTVPEELLGPLREMGVFGLSIPETYGGSAPADSEDSLKMIIVTEALSEASLGAAGSLITRPEILARALICGGTDEQKAEWLPRIAQGDPLCAIAITEPDFGSDVASLALSARRTEGGWVLNGAKTWCTFAGKAGLIMVVCRTDADRSLGYRGLSIMLVEKPSYDGHDFVFASPDGGRLTGHAIPTIGYRGMHSYDLAFEDFFVAGSHVLGGEQGLGKGFYFTMAGMQGGRLQTAARACGVMRAALLAAIRYASDRKVFGAPLGNFQLTRAKFARMAARLVACRQLTYAIGRMTDAGGGRMEASLAKLFACRAAEGITRDAIQIFGGMGYAEESAVSRYFVDARVLSIFEGAEETLALKVIARSLMERALGIEAG